MTNRTTKKKHQQLLPLGLIIRERREARGLTQRQLARRIGIGEHNFISMLENGNDSLPVNRVSAMAAALDLDERWLMLCALEERRDLPGLREWLIEHCAEMAAAAAAAGAAPDSADGPTPLSSGEEGA